MHYLIKRIPSNGMSVILYTNVFQMNECTVNANEPTAEIRWHALQSEHVSSSKVGSGVSWSSQFQMNKIKSRPTSILLNIQKYTKCIELQKVIFFYVDIAVGSLERQILPSFGFTVEVFLFSLTASLSCFTFMPTILDMLRHFERILLSLNHWNGREGQSIPLTDPYVGFHSIPSFLRGLYSLSVCRRTLFLSLSPSHCNLKG